MTELEEKSKRFQELILSFSATRCTRIRSCRICSFVRQNGSGDYKKMETINTDFVKELNKRKDHPMYLVFTVLVSVHESR
jgi:hypothetical protein